MLKVVMFLITKPMDKILFIGSNGNFKDAYIGLIQSIFNNVVIQDIGELDVEKTKRRGLLRDHWLLYAGGWYIFKNYPFYSYVFFLKTWGFTMWFVSCWYLFGRMATKIWRRNEQMQLQKTADDVMVGEDALVANMKKFANDSNAVEYLKQFKSETQSSFVDLRQALVNQQKEQVTERLNAQLNAISRMESASAGNMQDLLVNETYRLFKDAFSHDSKLQEAAFESALSSIKGGSSKKAASASDDPVLKHFSDAIRSVETADWSKTKADANGSIVERIANVKKQAESEFKKMFYVSKAEAAEIKEIAKMAAGDLAKLPAEKMKRLDDLYTAVNNRVGFVVPSESSLMAPGAGDQEAAKQVEAVSNKIKQERLKAFISAF